MCQLSLSAPDNQILWLDALDTVGGCDQNLVVNVFDWLVDCLVGWLGGWLVDNYIFGAMTGHDENLVIDQRGSTLVDLQWGFLENKKSNGHQALRLLKGLQTENYILG